ncbi:MAG: hypothetical protein AB2693_24870, partial [Candidatus Thiodiazotropha sp.]
CGRTLGVEPTTASVVNSNHDYQSYLQALSNSITVYIGQSPGEREKKIELIDERKRPNNNYPHLLQAQWALTRVKSGKFGQRVNSDSGIFSFTSQLFTNLNKINQANSVNPDETAPYEPSHHDFHCLQWDVRIYPLSEFTRLYPTCFYQISMLSWR